MKKKSVDMIQVKRFFIVLVLFSLFFTKGFAQSFPQGSTQGTMEMGNTVRPSESPVVPNISVEITSPQTGNEVAFSVRLLLLLTILTLAPSILILVTCFLRFSIVLHFMKRALS